MDETNVAVVENEAQVETQETPATEQPVEKAKRNTAPQDVFVQVWDDAVSRNDAVARLTELGYTATYSSVVARAKNLVNQGVALKTMPELKRGRKTNVEALNKLLAEKNAATAISEETEPAETVPAE